MGDPPWTGLDRLGTQLGVSEFNELAASVALAGDEGARRGDPSVRRLAPSGFEGSPTPKARHRPRASACRCPSCC